MTCHDLSPRVINTDVVAPVQEKRRCREGLLAQSEEASWLLQIRQLEFSVEVPASISSVTDTSNDDREHANIAYFLWPA